MVKGRKWSNIGKLNKLFKESLNPEKDKIIAKALEELEKLAVVVPEKTE